MQTLSRCLVSFSIILFSRTRHNEKILPTPSWTCAVRCHSLVCSSHTPYRVMAINSISYFCSRPKKLLFNSRSFLLIKKYRFHGKKFFLGESSFSVYGAMWMESHDSPVVLWNPLYYESKSSLSWITKKFSSDDETRESEVREKSFT